MAAAEQNESLPGLEQDFSEAGGDKGPAGPYATTQRLAGGLGGEKAAVEALATQGHQVLWYKPDILETNQGGIDAVTMKDGVVYLLDNKAYNTERNVSSVSALTTNFEHNLGSVKSDLGKVLTQPDLNHEQGQVIQSALDALDRGDYIKAVTNANIFSKTGAVPQDVTDRLEREHDIQFINLMPKSSSVAPASEARSEATPETHEPEALADRLPSAQPEADRSPEEPADERLREEEPAADRLPAEEPPSGRTAVEQSASYQPSEAAVYTEPTSVSEETAYHEPASSEDSSSSRQPSSTSDETSYRDTGYSYDPVSGSYQPSSTSEEDSTTHDESSLSSEDDSASSYGEDHSDSGESDTEQSDYEEPSYEDTSYEDTSQESDPVEEDHSSFDEEDR